MNELIRIMKRAAIEAVEEAKPTAVIFGSVSSVEPLKIRIKPKLILDWDFFLVPEHLKDMKMSQGDRLLLLRVQGGQSYVVLGKVGGE